MNGDIRHQLSSRERRCPTHLCKELISNSTEFWRGGRSLWAKCILGPMDSINGDVDNHEQESNGSGLHYDSPIQRWTKVYLRFLFTLEHTLVQLESRLHGTCLGGFYYSFKNWIGLAGWIGSIRNRLLIWSDFYKRFNCTFKEVNFDWTAWFLVWSINLIEPIKKLTDLKF